MAEWEYRCSESSDSGSQHSPTGSAIPFNMNIEVKAGSEIIQTFKHNKNRLGKSVARRATQHFPAENLKESIVFPNSILSGVRPRPW